MRNCSQRVSMFLACTALAMTAYAGQESKTETRVEVRTTTIPTTVRYEFNRSVRTGAIKKVKDGRDGVLKRTFEVTYVDGKPSEYKLLDQERTEPVPTLYHISRTGFQTSRGSFTRGKVLTMNASAYDPYPPGGYKGLTKMGYKAGFGHVAVDPRVIPLGSLVYVEGYGFAIASDIGGAIKGNRIDLCMPTRAQAYQFGRRKVKVHVLRTASPTK